MKTCVVLLVACLTGCAHAPRQNPNAWGTYFGVYFDGHNKSAEDRSLFTQDAAQCNQLAGESNPAAGAVGGAVVGALLGAVLFRSLGLSGNEGARFGGATGAISGAGNSAVNASVIYRNCMYGRNWRPLN